MVLVDRIVGRLGHRALERRRSRAAPGPSGSRPIRACLPLPAASTPRRDGRELQRLVQPAGFGIHPRQIVRGNAGAGIGASTFSYCCCAPSDRLALPGSWPRASGDRRASSNGPPALVLVNARSSCPFDIAIRPSRIVGVELRGIGGDEGAQRLLRLARSFPRPGRPGPTGAAAVHRGRLPAAIL